MRGMRHPLSGALYELCDDGVLVSLGDDAGLYDSHGRWLSGRRMTVCPNFCAWIGDGPRDPVDLSSNRRFRNVLEPNLGDTAEARS